MNDTPSNRRQIWRIVVLIGLLGLLGGLYFSGLANRVSFEQVKSEVAHWQDFVDRHLLLGALIFFVVYLAVTGLSLPMASWLSLVAGALFGRWIGTGLVSVAATGGATLAMLASRYLLRDWLLARYNHSFSSLRERFLHEGPYFLLTLRLIPLFPFWMVNLGMGLTPISCRTYILLSWLGMLPGTFFYVSLGTDLSQLESPQGLLTLAVLRWFLFLGLFPWVVRLVLRYFKPKTD